MKGKKYDLELLIEQINYRRVKVSPAMKRILEFFNNYYLTNSVPLNHDGPGFDRVRHVSDFIGVSYKTTKRILHSLEEVKMLDEVVTVSKSKGTEHRYGFAPMATRHLR